MGIKIIGFSAKSMNKLAEDIRDKVQSEIFNGDEGNKLTDCNDHIMNSEDNLAILWSFPNKYNPRQLNKISQEFYEDVLKIVGKNSNISAGVYPEGKDLIYVINLKSI